MNSPRPQPILSARGLEVGYGPRTRSERKLAGPLNLSLAKGELVCLLGPNGAGKSTLLKTLCGFLPPLQGTIEIDSKAINHYSLRELARVRAVLPSREAPPGAMTSEELVTLGRHPHSNWAGSLSDQDHAAIDAAFTDSGSDAFRKRPVRELSDGERQRVSLARLLAQEPQLAFLDEPSAFLDLPSRIQILEKLASIAHERQIAILLTTHDLESALRHADRLWLLDAHGEWRDAPPEDAVLRGDVSATFSSHNLNFDISSGSFTPAQLAGNPIQLIGAEPHRLWTARGMQRKGWSPTHRDGTDLRVEIRTSPDEKTAHWTVFNRDRVTAKAHSIQELLENLSNDSLRRD